MRRPLTENIIEQSAIDILQMQGWEYGKGIEISPKPSSAPQPDFSPCTNSFQFVPCRTNLISLPPRHLLSKSTFMMGMQCPKSLWLHKHRPEFIYNTLTIGNGGDASVAFSNLKQMEDEKENQEIRKALLDYCGLDTLGMVRICKKQVVI